jgi:uncharacterized protein (TIGR02996 family)
MTREELLADIRKQPDRDEPRLVYADWLIERGDPRGELIELQCRGTGEKRAAQLIRAHEREWLPGAEHADEILWERGFVKRVHIKSDLPRNADELKEHLPGTKLAKWIASWTPDGGPDPEIDYGGLPLLYDSARRRAAVVMDGMCTSEQPHICAPDPYGDGSCMFLSHMVVLGVPDGQLVAITWVMLGIQKLAWSSDETRVIGTGVRYKEGEVSEELAVPPA